MPGSSQSEIGGNAPGSATRPTVSAIARRIHGWSWQAVSIFLRRVFRATGSDRRL